MQTPQMPARIIQKFLPLIHKDNVGVFRTIVVIEICREHNVIAELAEAWYDIWAKKLAKDSAEKTPLTAQLLLDTIP